MSDSIGVFTIAVVIGYFVLPILLKKEAIRSFLTNSTNSEAASRDKMLKFITDRISFISPNFVSWVGLLFVFILAYAFQQEMSYVVIFFLTLFAGFTDMLDGSLARNSNRVTKMGAGLDVIRDVFLAIVVSYYLIASLILPQHLFLWFAIGWIFLGVIRTFEFQFASKPFSLDDDFKFALDRVRLFLYIVGILFLILIPLLEDFRTLGETFVVTAVVISWISLMFHAAHLKILRDEKLELL